MSDIATPTKKAGALGIAWRLSSANNTPPHLNSQRAGRWRGVLHRLAAAARGGLLASFEASFIVSIQRQAERPGWRPSLRQFAILARIDKALAEADEPLIDEGDLFDLPRVPT